MVEWPPSRAGNWGPQGVGKLVEVGIGPFQEVPNEGNPEGYTATRKIGLPGLLMILLSWGDFSYPCGLITGLPTAGFAPNYGVFPFHAAPFLSCRLMKFLMERSPTMQISCIVCGRVRMMPLCWSSQGFCSQPVKKPELLLAVLKGQRFRLIPRCAVTQANSKQRIIDDAARGGQRSLSSDQSKLVLCTPLRPAQHIAAVASVMSEELWAHSCRSDTWLGAGETGLKPTDTRPSTLMSRLRVWLFFGTMNGKNQLSRSIAACLLFGLPSTATVDLQRLLAEDSKGPLVC